MVWMLVLGLVANLTHVAAHLLAARLFAVTVNRVSIGFGPTLWSRGIGGTTVRVALFPLPVIVRLRAPSTEEAQQERPSTDLRNRSALVRLAVFASAPVAVLLLAFLAAFWMHGFETVTWSEEPVAGTVEPGLPAALAGIRDGDAIKAINGKRAERWNDLTRLISESKGMLELEIQRAGESLTIEVEPRLEDGRRLIGIRPIKLVKPAPSVPGRLIASMETITNGSAMGFKGVGALVARKQTKYFARPHAYYAILSSPAASLAQSRAVTATGFFLSCFFWCLFWPFLDGIRLLFWGIEAIARRPIHPKHERRFSWIWLAVVVVMKVSQGAMRLAERF